MKTVASVTAWTFILVVWKEKFRNEDVVVTVVLESRYNQLGLVFVNDMQIR